MNQSTETPEPASDVFEKAVAAQPEPAPAPEPELDAYNRDRSKWINVNGKLRPHP